MSHIRASYTIIDYIKEKIDAMLAPDTCEFYPGTYATGASDISSAMYTVIQGVDQNLTSVNTDLIRIMLYHQDFDMVQRISSMLLADLNSDNAKDNSVLYAAGIEANIKYHMYICDITRNDFNSFLEGTEYYVIGINILHQYVELGGLPESDSVSLYINGA